jgi:hypothetical protein
MNRKMEHAFLAKYLSLWYHRSKEFTIDEHDTAVKKKAIGKP